jgi:hypothetical protein
VRHPAPNDSIWYGWYGSIHGFFHGRDPVVYGHYRTQYVADFNGDGKRDILWIGGSGGAWYGADATVGFTNAPYMPYGIPEAQYLAFARFDGDNKDDMFTWEDPNPLYERSASLQYGR